MRKRKEVVKKVPTEYEQDRLDRIAENNKRLHEILGPRPKSGAYITPEALGAPEQKKELLESLDRR
jgi:hypothetical protein